MYCGNILFDPYSEYGKRFNWLADRVKLTRKEKYEFLLAVKNKPEEDVIKFIREHPWVISCMFWFETDTCTIENGTKTLHDRRNCSCSEDLEICKKEGIDEDEMINRLEISIAYGMCPHLIFAKYGLSVSCKQEITSTEIFKVWDTSDITNNVRHISRPSAGVYLIHLLILYCKFEILKAVLPLYTTMKVKIEDMISVKHHISPVLFAVAHYRISMAKMIAQNFPHFPEDLTFREPCWVSFDCLRHGELYVALMTNQFNGFTTLLPFHNNLCHDKLLMTWELWAKKLGKCIEEKRKVEAELLLSPKKIPIWGYNYLFHYAYETGCYSIYHKVLRDTKFYRQFLKRKQDVHMTRTLDELMVKAVFSGDPNVVQLFVNRGFNVNATFLRITVLKWAEYLAYDDVCKVLESSKSFRKNDNGDPILVCLINHGVFRRMSYRSPAIDPLPIIHQACESGRCSYLPFDAFQNAFRYEYMQYDIIKYFLLRGCDASYFMEKLDHNDRRVPIFFHLLISSNAKLKFDAILKFYTKGIYRHIIKTVAEPNVLDMIYDVTSNHLNANKEELLTNNLLRTSIGKSEEDLAKYVDWIGKPQSLKNICRRFFRSTYRVAKYVVFLKSIKTVVPASIHNYLSMQDFLEFLLPDSELKEIEEKTKNAEKYVLKCSPDQYELHLHDSN
ncbi:uncharacterized protein [Mytilus edulis]|uniref:uncharacterized protein isoform X1 n=2 Tax=Mytilus edulis TaxID=6550 RepID=UPI0039EE0966